VSITSGKTGTDGSTTTGNSTMAALATTGTTNTFAWKVVDFANNPGAGSQTPVATPGSQGGIVGDAFTDLIVMWNFGIHEYFIATATH
jgi:hypothetical protein